MRKELIITLAITALVLFLAIGMVFLTGQTFGQRCAKAYPDDPAQQERCVIRLNKGGTRSTQNQMARSTINEHRHSLRQF